VNTLVIDTSGDSLGLALELRDGAVLSCTHRSGLRQAELLAPAVRALLSQAGLSASSLELVGCCIGPGSFTGVRIGMATAKGLAAGAGCAIVGVPSLDAMALRLSFYRGLVVPVADARRGRLYAAVYANGERRSEYLDLEPDALGAFLLQQTGESGLLLTGPFAQDFAATLERMRAGEPRSAAVEVDARSPQPDPLALLELARARYRDHGPDGDELSPLYLRPSEAEINAGRPRSGSPPAP
jgi:tRNA threonylcarbamoyladenosine biosynthesis protein TsaB